MSSRNVGYSLLKLGGTFITLLWALLIIAPAYAQQIDQVLTEETDSQRVKANRIAVDSAGNRYVFGQFNGNVIFGSGDRSVALNGTQTDVYIAKYNKDGILQWAKEFETGIVGAGGVPSATAAGIDVDEPNNALYVTGTFMNGLLVDSTQLVSTDFNPDVFLVRLNLNTGAVEWINQVKGTQLIGVNALDANSNVAITGKFTGISDFTGQFNTSKTLLALTAGGADMFVAVYSPAGELVTLRQAGGGTGSGPRGAEGNSVHFGSGGAMTVVGGFAGTVRFDGVTPPIQLTSVGGDDGFVARYNSNGQLRFVKQIGSANSESALLVVHNKQGSKVYVIGGFRGTLTIGSTVLTSLGENDRFIVRYDTLNGTVERVSQIGSNNTDFLQGLATDELNNVYVTGRFFGPQLTIGTGSNAIQVPQTNFTSYIAGMNADLTPIFGQTIQGKFNANYLVAEGNGTLHLAGGYEDTVVLGAGTQTITLTNPTGDEAMAVARYRPEPLPPFDPSMLYVSAATGGTVNGIAFQDEDILAFDPADGSWSLLIDGSDLGLGSTDIDAFEWLSDQTVLMSFNTSVNLAGVGLVGDEDLVRFTPRLLGATTAGNFEMFLDGSTLGLDISDENEDIDAVTVTPEGVIISVQGTARVPSRNGELVVGESDLLLLDRNRQWSLYMQGGDIGLTLSSEDLNALSIANNGLHLSTLGAFTISGANSQGQAFSVSGDASDVTTCIPESLGVDTRMESCTLSFDGSANGLTGIDVDAIAGGRNTTQGTDFSDDSGVIEPSDGADDVILENSRLILPMIVR